MYKQELTLDLFAAKMPQIIHAKQGDSGRTIVAAITQNGEPYYHEAGMSAAIRVLSADKRSTRFAAELSTDATTNESVVIAKIPALALAVAGTASADVTLTNSDGEIISTLNFLIDIQAAPESDNLIAEPGANVPLSALNSAGAAIGQVLTMTEDGIAWANPATGSGGSSGTITTEQVPFTETGSEVVCTPTVGSELSVAATIPFSRAGSGDPSLTNVRNISGAETLTVTRSEDSAQLTAAIGQAFAAAKFGWTASSLPSGVTVAVADGTVDFNTGVLSVSKWILNLPISSMNNNNESYPGWNLTGTVIAQLFGNAGNVTANATNGVLTVGEVSFQTNFAGRISLNTNNGNLYLPRSYYGNEMTESQWREQYPALVLQLCFTLSAQETIQLTPQTMTAIAGTNTLSTNIGTLTVSGLRTVTITEPDTSDEPTSVGSVLAGKKIAILGDSISTTDIVSGNDKTWWQQIAEKTGAVFAVNAISGTSIAYVASLETSKGPCFVNRYTQMDDTADGVIVMGGTNDAYKSPVGTWSSTDTSTFYGALNTLIPGLLSKYPGKPILFCTMMQTKNGYTGNVSDPVGALAALAATATTGNRQLLAEAIKAKCRQYSVPCLDLYNESGISGAAVVDSSAIYYKDDLHPSAAGQERLADLIGAKLTSLFYS